MLKHRATDVTTRVQDPIYTYVTHIHSHIHTHIYLSSCQPHTSHTHHSPTQASPPHTTHTDTEKLTNTIHTLHTHSLPHITLHSHTHFTPTHSHLHTHTSTHTSHTHHSHIYITPHTHTQSHMHTHTHIHNSHTHYKTSELSLFSVPHFLFRSPPSPVPVLGYHIKASNQSRKQFPILFCHPWGPWDPTFGSDPACLSHPWGF